MKTIKIVIMILIIIAYLAPIIVVVSNLNDNILARISMSFIMLYIGGFCGYTLQVFNKWFDSKLKEEEKDETT